MADGCLKHQAGGTQATRVAECICEPATDVVRHRCPLGDSMFAPCCGRPAHELPQGDRITTDPRLVTCWTGSDPRLTEEADRG